MDIIKFILKSIIIILIMLSALIAAFEFTSPPGVSKPFTVKRECLDTMSKIQGASYFYLMERPRFNGVVEVDELIRGGYLNNFKTGGCYRAGSLNNNDCQSSSHHDYKIIYKKNGIDISYIDVVCINHGYLSRQGDSDKNKGLPEGFVDNYIARVKTRFNMYGFK